MAQSEQNDDCKKNSWLKSTVVVYVGVNILSLLEGFTQGEGQEQDDLDGSLLN